MAELTAPRRSQLLEVLLQQQLQRPQIQSTGELGARLLAQALRQRQVNKLRGEEEAEQTASNQRIADALSGKQILPLEDPEGGTGSISIPARRGEGQRRNLSGLSAEERLAAAQIAGAEKALLPQPDKPKDVSRVGQRVVTPDKGKPFTAEIFFDPNRNQLGFYGEQGGFTPVSGNRLSEPTRREEVRTGPLVDDKKINTDARNSADASSALRRNLTGTIPELEENQGSVGIRGKGGAFLGGLTAVFLGDQAGDEIAKMIAGNDIEGISQIQTRLQTLRAQIIPIVTGETSSRFSEPERQIADRAIGLIDEIKGPADLTRTFPQIVGAMKELTLASMENEFEQARRSDAVDFPFDLNTDQGIIELGTILSESGYTLEEAKRVRDRLLRIQNGL